MKDKEHTVSVRIWRHLAERVRELSVQENRSITAIVSLAVQQNLEQRKKK